MCDIESTNPPPIFQEDRKSLNKFCLKSFVGAFKNMEAEIHFILDHCSEGWEDIIEDIHIKHTVERTELGINDSATHAVKKALEFNDDILFQECDYLYMPNTGPLVKEAIKHFGVISPYDHPDKYPGDTKIDMFNGLYWRTTPSTTQTYGITKENLNKYKDIILKHGYIDHAMWIELSENGLELRTPVPSIATHMVKDYMAPIVNWERVGSTYL